MREAVYHYLNTYEPFNLFGTEHIIGNSISLLIIILLPLYAKRNLDKDAQHTVGKVIGWMVFSNYILWVILEIIAGTFDIRLHLPVHLCRLANIMMPLVMVWRNYFAFEILFFWGFSGMIQATITPDISAGFPHFHYFRFWIGHQGMIMGLVYATVIYEMRPTIKSLWKAFIALNIMLVIAAIVNGLIGTNYLWICGKPTNHLGEHLPTIMDYFGPWPWYILTAEIFALLHFGLAYTPIYLLKKKKASQ